MTKIIAFSLLITAALVVFNREKIENYKQKIIETINPAAKEQRLLAELDGSLSQLETVLSNSANNEKLSSSDQQKLKKAISQSKTAIEELKENSQKNDLSANLSNLLQKIIPFDSKPSPTWLPPSQECKSSN